MSYTLAFEKLMERIQTLVRVADRSAVFKRPELAVVQDLLRWSLGLGMNVRPLPAKMREVAIAQMAEGICNRLREADELLGAPEKFGQGTDENEAICEVMESLWEFGQMKK